MNALASVAASNGVAAGALAGLPCESVLDVAAEDPVVVLEETERYGDVELQVIGVVCGPLPLSVCTELGMLGGSKLGSKPRGFKIA